jgi:hypothetical protein
MPARHLLHLLSQGADLGALVLIGGGDGQRHEAPQRIDGGMYLRAHAPLVRAGAGARSGLGASTAPRGHPE